MTEADERIGCYVGAHLWGPWEIRDSKVNVMTPADGVARHYYSGQYRVRWCTNDRLYRPIRPERFTYPCGARQQEGLTVGIFSDDEHIRL